MATIRLDSTRSDEAMQKAAYKKEILSAKKLFEASAQVPSPSKDFAQILITEGGVVWRRWKITLRGISSGGVPSPNEEAMTHEDFGYDTTLQDQVERIFGAELLRQMKRILSGSRDELSKLPEGVMVGVATYLDLQSIARLAQVNRHLREVCNSDALWQRLYTIHQGSPNADVRALAADTSWKSVFFLNKLQLQKELSRRRRLGIVSPAQHQNGRGPSTGVKQSSSATFLTQDT